jgi:ABC-type multidrug transport system permease subunit
MPLWLQSIAMINPLTYAVTPMRVIAIQGWVWGDIWVGVVVLTLMAIAAVTLAITQFERAVM